MTPDSQREWLETNGLGGYASSTVCGMNTRRYHGLLVAATKPPVGRMVLLSKIEETVIVGGQRYELSVNQYPGVVHPRGDRYLKQFRRDPYPAWVYECNGVELEKSLFMPQGENAVAIRYELRGSGTLELRPLIAFRDYHATTHENGALDRALTVEAGRVRMTPYRDLPSLYVTHDADDVTAADDWYCNFEFERERERGLDFREDLFHPCTLTAELHAGRTLTVIASTEPHDLRTAHGDGERSAAEQFLARRGAGHSVIAGYHWFGDWGRDTMIALPGLTLTTGRAEVARGILRAFAAVVDRGMLPNRFPDSGETPEYNTVDATLWFFEAVRAYLEHTGDLDFVRGALYPVLADIVAWHERGTRFGIRVDSDGLLMAGEQLTWMDARVDGQAVTPRSGKAVEIQALWYNALRIMEELAPAVESQHYRELADRAAASFTPLFWNASMGCLYDVVNGTERDASIRPNQILAVSLPHSMLAPDLAAQVVEVVRRELLTPYGLRTLATGDPRYRGRYEGGQRNRDQAYHQGTVWPWLMGPFVDAYLKTGGDRAQARQWTEELQRYRNEEGMGQLPEIFDGDAPHAARGCIAQAWSVAELLRVQRILA